MKTAAIVCEYNPFHNGHKFHIEETKRQTGADAVVLIMSGNFVQRGDVAIFAKALRAKAAILGGADLVLELPTPISCASAEFFASGAVSILDALGIVDFLSFGAESPESEDILKIASLLAKEPKELSDKIKMYSNTGLSYPLARAKATEDILGEDAAKTLSSPNNILGIEYCKALIKLQSRISPFPILRKGADHDSKTTFENIASATHIRELILNGNQAEADKYMPDFAVEIFKDAKRHSIKALEKSILCELIKMPAEALANIADVSEGLENRIKATLTPSVSLDELIESIKTKRYTHSRISRIILSAFLGITDSQRRTSPMYIKVLDHNETGQKVIAAAKKSAALPIVRNTSQINKLKNPDLKAIWEKEQMFDRIFEMTAM